MIPIYIKAVKIELDDYRYKLYYYDKGKFHSIIKSCDPFTSHSVLFSQLYGVQFFYQNYDPEIRYNINLITNIDVDEDGDTTFDVVLFDKVIAKNVVTYLSIEEFKYRINRLQSSI
jgi:hypothetical protein